MRLWRRQSGVRPEVVRRRDRIREIDGALFRVAQHFAEEGRSVYVRFTGGQQLRIDAEGVTANGASDKQLSFIRDLCDRKGVVAPEGPLTKAQASEIIDSLNDGSYDPDKWQIPF